MYIIKRNAFENGIRPPLQTWSKPTPPEGYAFCPEEFFGVFYSTEIAGFVDIVIEGDIVTEMTVNQEAHDAYIATLPEPEPMPEADEGDEAVTWNELAQAYSEGVNSIDE